MVTIRTPDDWHLHLRDGAQMRSVLAHSAQRFRRAVVMPNLKPPVVSAELAGAYRQRIIAALPAGSKFEPLMTLYLTDRTRPEDIDAAKQSGFVLGAKLYPAGATTHSDAGVRSIDNLRGALERMEEAGLPLLVHGEVTDPAVDVFDRESRFIDQVLMPLVDKYGDLKVVLEHVTTGHGVEFVRTARAGVAATVTVHHLLFNRNALFKDGLRPHYYCLPVLKREHDREALLEAATSGNPRFFLGTDSAPHSRATKETGCGCAGLFTAHAAIELYAEVFDAAGHLGRLEGFASDHGADFYGLARNSGTITLVKEPWKIPETLDFGGEPLVPLRAGETVAWRLQA